MFVVYQATGLPMAQQNRRTYFVHQPCKTTGALGRCQLSNTETPLRSKARGIAPTMRSARKVRDVACEPPEVAWEHLGLSLGSLGVRAVLGAVAVVVSFIAIAAAVFLPLATYSINYVDQAGSLPTGVMMSVMGILVMTVNWMIGLLHIFVSSKVGFTRRDREGILIFKAFSTLCLVSFLFNVAITIFPESSAHPLRFLVQPLGEGRAVTSMQDISFQVRASVHLFHVPAPEQMRAEHGG
ncbi:unnamed protein product [Symbiodinium natans]|uniref:Uncharacterized protein n=1 Tax=Symbiodinium natans TaxID=878477 RepID=A0A812KZZ2_9DINO|nr:unnamed protein product [Symbiodinium natans]